ncbi:hypothetical protein H0H93_005821 [Arthromyces matolae]|nr:hypothetical protein H0H93_005821 [Arthromyces matolae]
MMDTIVGIRYLHPIEYKDAPTYRRFQITFLSSVAVLEFIQKISPVCPCKANPAINSVPRMMNPPPVPLQSYRTTSLVHAPSQLARSESMAPQLPIQGAQTPFSTSPSLPLPINLSSNAPTSQNSMPSSSPIIQSTIDTHLANPSQQSIYVSCNPLVQETQPEVLVKIPSPTTAVNRNENAETCVSPTTVGGSAPESPFLASLRESTDMYHLSRAQLEQLVGEVVREEGFAKLMEDLNSMWAVKAVVGV